MNNMHLSVYREAIPCKTRLAGNGVPFTRGAPTVGALGDAADDGFSIRPKGDSQMTQYRVAAFIKGTTINCRLRLVLSHL